LDIVKGIKETKEYSAYTVSLCATIKKILK